MPQLIPAPELYSLSVWFAPCFTAPSFAHFVSFIVCFACGLGRMTATTFYRTSPRLSHWTNYSRFLLRYRWSVRRCRHGCWRCSSNAAVCSATPTAGGVAARISWATTG